MSDFINSHQGVAFISKDWITALCMIRVFISELVGKGSCIYNAYIETFWRSIKYENIKLSEFNRIHELENLIFYYIDNYYNHRPHQARGEFIPDNMFNDAKTVS